MSDQGKSNDAQQPQPQQQQQHQQQQQQQQQQPPPQQTHQQPPPTAIPTMHPIPFQPISNHPPPPLPPGAVGPPHYTRYPIITRIPQTVPIIANNRPQFIIPQHPMLTRPPHPHPSQQHQQQMNNDPNQQQQLQHPHPQYHPQHIIHPQHPHPPPPQLFNAQYASGRLTHIGPPQNRMIPIHPHTNMILTPIHPPPPGVGPPHVVPLTTFNPQQFSVPPIQTVYSQNGPPPPHHHQQPQQQSTNNNGTNSGTSSPNQLPPPPPPPIPQNIHMQNGNTLTYLGNIRQRELLPINPNNPIYANSQQIQQSNPNQNIPPHIQNTLNQMNINNTKDNNGIITTNKQSTPPIATNGVGLSQVPTLQPMQIQSNGPFQYKEFQAQRNRINAWNRKKVKQEERLKQFNQQHNDDNNNNIGIPRNHNIQNNVTGRAHFVPAQHNTNYNAYGTQKEYMHIGYNQSRYQQPIIDNNNNNNNNTLNSRKRKFDVLSDVSDTETEEEDIDMMKLYDTSESDSDPDDDLYGEPKKKKRKKNKKNKSRNGNTISKAERKKQYEHYMKQFEGIEDCLDELKHIEPPQNLKKTRKEYQKKLEIEKILHRTDEVDQITGLTKYKYYILWKNLSYIHCEWITEENLLSDRQGSSKLKRFLKNNIINWQDGMPLYDDNWITVDRILAARPGPGYHFGDTRFEYLVKFNGLSYRDSRWEFANDIDDDASITLFQTRSILPHDAYEPKIRPRPEFYKKLLASNNKFTNNNKLHEWQIEGVNWLTFNWYHRRGGILADEMGLGKTVQVVATLNRISKYYTGGPFLIVAPLSTVEHWKREILGWTNLNPVIFQGNKEDRRICHFFEFRYFDNTGRRLLSNDLYKFNVLITTYESVMLDDELLNIKWKICVVDEAHRLKNNEAKLSKYLRKCNIEHNILLTGTPIQNNMRELWNLLNFVDPNNFNNFDEFEYKYGDDKMQSQSNDNDKDDNDKVSKINSLKKVLEPYFLRRLKEDVAKFIPQKKETIIEVELTRIQKQYYKALLTKNRQFLYKGVSNRNQPKLMNIANDLRKICNHPYLINGAYDRITISAKTMKDKISLMINSSGKFILLHKLLPKLKNDGHKILIFSQWRITLDWVEEFLRCEMYKFERIDGHITGNERQAAIDRFCKKNSKTFIFLLTTKAGGVGLNLMAADTVIIFDSDWNPQNDIQAMARCHRIGQKKAVKVYRLITSKSYEKEMFIKASKKLGLGQAIMGTMNNDMNNNKNKSTFNHKEISNLLKHGAYHIFQDDDKECDSFSNENIEDILKNRVTDIVFDKNNNNNNNNNSAFSRATFISSDDAANINIDDADFWEKILPKELNPKDMIEQLDNKDFQQKLINNKDEKDKFWNHLIDQFDEVRELRESGMAGGNEINMIVKLLNIVANKPNIFSDKQRVKANDWASYIENPRRFKRQNPNSSSLRFGRNSNRNKERKLNIYRTRSFTPKEVYKLIKLFFDSVSTTTDNVFNIILSDYSKIDKNNNNNNNNGNNSSSNLKIYPRKLREITGWCCAFILYLATQSVDTRTKAVFDDIKSIIRKLIPKHFNDSPTFSNYDNDDYTSSIDSDYNPTSKKSKKSKKKLPQNCKVKDFPSFKEKWFERIVSKESRNWTKRMILVKELRTKTKNIKNINNINISDNIGGNKPTPWWTKEDDKNLVIGASIHGVNNWDNIRKDVTLGFMKKCCDQNNNNNDNNITEKKTNSTNTNNGAAIDNDNKNNNDNDNNDNDVTMIDKDDSRDPNYRKCCGTTRQSKLNVQCDQCEEFCHAECCGIYSVDDIPGIWFCFECNGNWPKATVLYERLAAVLHSIKKTSKRKRSSKKKKDSNNMDVDKSNKSGNNSRSKGSSRSRPRPRPRRRESKRSKLNNSRTRVGRMWNFSLKEMHALQRTVQIYGKVPWNELKLKSKSPKNCDQIEAYFFSFMSNVEYLIRCERLKELIVTGKIELPYDLQQKFCRPGQLSKHHHHRNTIRSISQTPTLTNIDTRSNASSNSYASNVPPLLSSTKSSSTKPNNNNNIKSSIKRSLSDNIKGESMSLLSELLADNMISKYFASFKSTNTDTLTLSDIYSKIELNQYTNPKQIFNHIQTMIDHKLNKNNNNNQVNNNDIQLCINKINQVVKQKKQHILINFANEESKYLSKYSSNVSSSSSSSIGSSHNYSSSVGNYNNNNNNNYSSYNYSSHNYHHQQQQHHHHTSHVNLNRYRIKKTDMDMLSEHDVEKYFKLKKPESIVNHQLTVNLANKVWQRAQMWVELRKVEKIDDNTLTKLYTIVKAQRNEPGTNSKLPEWWHPPKHDRLIITLILKHGMQQTPDIVLSDALFKKQIDVKEQKDFLERFFVPKKPLILRLRYVSYVLTHGGQEPTKDSWHYTTLPEIQGSFFYNPIQTRDEYTKAMNDWFEQNEMIDSHSPAPSSSIDLGLLSSKSPRRTGKSSELVERYRTLARDEDGELTFPIQAKQGASIINLGEIVFDRKLFGSSKYIWPNGFESQRIHPSYLEPSQRVVYTSKIIDGGDRPKFAVIASDDAENPIIANSASTAWTNIITKVNFAKDPDKRRKTCTVSGPEMFGYNDPLIIALIEELPNSECVLSYWKNRTPFKDVLQAEIAAQSRSHHHDR